MSVLQDLTFDEEAEEFIRRKIMRKNFVENEKDFNRRNLV